MMFIDLLTDAFKNIKRLKLRSFLATLGIFVGTASVVAMISGGELATRQALAQFKSLGTNLLSVTINDAHQQTTKNPVRFSLENALQTKNISSNIEIVAPYTVSFARLAHQGKNADATTIGTTENLAKIMRLQLLHGRFVSYYDKTTYYCVLGYDIYQKLKNQLHNPIGQQIRINNDYFTVIGILKHQKDSAFIYTDINHSVFMPLQTSLLLSQYTTINNLIMRLAPHAKINILKQNINQYFQNYYPNKKIFIRSAEQFIQGMEKQRKILTIFLGLIGSISLIVGGIGVMNIMLVSVTERRKEIGIRLAVGATRREIQLLFLVEATLLSLIGGIMGVIVGVLISYIIAKSKHWGFTLFFDPPMVGFLVSVIIGVFFGFYPAHKASKLDPIDTLHSE